jgi:hypothetical protein
MVVWFTTTYVISTYYYQCCELEPSSWRGVLDKKLYIETCFHKNVFASFKKIYLKCFFANILLISFIFNIKFMFCTCIIVVDIFCSFRIEICNITPKFEFPPLVSMKTISFGSANNKDINKILAKKHFK